jgi:hypothetical protein
MHTVRTTMQPDREIEVDDADYLDLKRQGLLVEDPAPEPQPAPAVAPAPVKKAASKES